MAEKKIVIHDVPPGTSNPFADAWTWLTHQGPQVNPSAQLGPGAARYLSQVGGEDNALKNYKKDQTAEKQAAQNAALQKERELQIQAIQNSPWTQLGNAAVQQMSQALAPLQAMTSGSDIPQAQTNAAGLAEALTGTSPGSNTGQWLSQQTAAAQQATAPITAAMGNVSRAYQQGENSFSQALQNYAQANALEVETAPQASWLNALAQHVQSNLSYGGTVPSADLPLFEGSPGLTQALQQAGGYGAAGGGTGLVSIAQLPTKPGQKVQNTGIGSGAGISSGVVPSASSYPSG